MLSRVGFWDDLLLQICRRPTALQGTSLYVNHVPLIDHSTGGWRYNRCIHQKFVLHDESNKTKIACPFIIITLSSRWLLPLAGSQNQNQVYIATAAEERAYNVNLPNEETIFGLSILAWLFSCHLQYRSYLEVT